MKPTKSIVLYSLFLLTSSLFVGSCSKPKLVYYSPKMVQSASTKVNSHINQQVNNLADSLLSTVAQHRTLTKTYFYKHSNQTTTPTIVLKKGNNIRFRESNIAQTRQRNKVHSRFVMMYIGLGVIVLAGILILILANIPNLKGDEGCIMFFALVLLAGVGLLTAVQGLIAGLLNG